MLPKKQRLNLKIDFKPVAAGYKKQTPNLKLFYRTDGGPIALVGIATSKKEFAKANQRNLARRRVSQAVQNLYPTLRKSLKLVIMPKNSCLMVSVEELEKELTDVPTLYHSN